MNKPRESNKEKYKKTFNCFERLGFLTEIDSYSIKMILQTKFYQLTSRELVADQ